MVDLGDKAREDFLSEAQEIVDRLSRDLLMLDATTRVGPADPDLVNGVFRGVHTLKGLSGLFNATRLGTMSHELENVLDGLRLGRLELSPELLDVLFRGVEVYNRLLTAEHSGSTRELDEEFESFMRNLRAVIGARVMTDRPPTTYDLDPGVLAVLTEYEEHRLRLCLEQGLALYRIRIVFKLATIDDGLERLKERLKPFGEILTYLPSGGGADVDSIELEVLFASTQPAQALTAVLEELNGSLEEVPRRAPSSPNLKAPSAPSLPSEVAPASSAPEPDQSRSLSMSPPAPVEHAGAAGRLPASLRSVTQTVRVDIQKLDHLMNLLGELAIVRSSLERTAERLRADPQLRELSSELGRLHHNFERHLAAMQSGIIEVRMVPLGQVFEKLARVARQASREVEKPVNLVITGAETEVDKLIGEELSDPLMHMIRNALDHGIEEAAARLKVGKPAVGTIALNAYQKGNQVVIEVEDDGAGIDEAKLVESAVRAGILTADEAKELSRRDILHLIFVPGVTTREGAGKLSGRGVGMDVVKTNIARLGGVVDVHSEFGIGTKLTITLPITLAIISALMVRVGPSTYAVPLSSVQEAVMVDPSAVRLVEGRELVTMRGASLPLCRLDLLFGVRAPGVPADPARKLIVVVAAAASLRCGFVVDDILGRQDIVIKALTGPLRGTRGFAGATELGDQRIGLVVDIPSLLEEAMSSTTGYGVRADG